jgi:hypothetical protein
MNAEWLHWYYLVFLLPGVFAMLMLLLSGLGGHHAGHGHAAHGGHGGLRLHLHAHHGGGHAAAGGHAAHAGHTHGHAAHGQESGQGRSAGPGPAEQILGFFGFGRAPLAILLASMLIGWGFGGIVALEVLRPILRLPAIYFLPAVGVALVSALVSLKLFGGVAARFMPEEQSCAIPQEGLLGLTGRVVFRVSDETGRVHVFDQYRTLHVAPARVAPGTEPIEKGTDVIVASMDPDRRYVVVEPLGFSRKS